ncbi:hypothetical protein ACFFJ7_06565 [Pseudochelatococcus lubricantis]|uniref:hypothetical protein n=1 Tax=Pseudochelatococcus lubricantis TaxID=1538102 RepID=UPI0035EE56EF
MSRSSLYFSMSRTIPVFKVAGALNMPMPMRMQANEAMWTDRGWTVQTELIDTNRFAVFANLVGKASVHIGSGEHKTLICFNRFSCMAGQYVFGIDGDLPACASLHGSRGPLPGWQVRGRTAFHPVHSQAADLREVIDPLPPRGLRPGRLVESAVKLWKTMGRHLKSEAAVHLCMHAVVIGGMVWLAYVAGYAGVEIMGEMGAGTQEQIFWPVVQVTREEWR